MRMYGAIIAILDRDGILHIGSASLRHKGTSAITSVVAHLHDAMKSEGVRTVDRRDQPLTPPRAACIHCMQDVADLGDFEAIRQHSMTCAASPVVQELAAARQRISHLEVELGDALQELDEHKTDAAKAVFEIGTVPRG